MAALTYDQVTSIVAANNKTRGPTAKSAGIYDRLFVCLIWKESAFDPDAASSTSSATGLMQITRGAVAEVNRVRGTTYDHANMTDPNLNVEVGTTYIDILMVRHGNRLAAALDQFGTGSGYSDDIINCSRCLGRAGSHYARCLHLIHK